MANLKYIGKNILNHDLILKKGDVSGSNASTGSFGNLSISNNASVTGDMVVGGTLTAQEIHTEIESASIIFTSGSTKFGDTSDDTHEFTGSILVKGDLTAENLTADSSSFSTRVTNLKSDSGSFSTRTTTLEAASASFSTRVTTAETELELTLISGSAQIATQISGAFDSVSSSLSSRLQIAETELENTLISGSAQLASQISGAFTSGFEFDGTISGSATSTGSFGNGEFSDTLRVGVTTPATHFSPIHLRGNASQTSTAMGTLLLEETVGHGGIALNAPANKQTHLRFQGNGTLLWQVRMPQHDGTNPDSLRFYSYTHNNDVMTLKNDGTVGIGTINPAERLDVVGNIQASGNISGSSTSTGSFGAGFIDNRLGIGTTSPISPLHAQFSAVSYNHSYAYTEKGITMEADEPMIQLIANDTNTHGGSMLMRYGDNVFATVANTTADDLEFSYAVTSGNGFAMHGGGSNVTSFKKIMALNKGGNITIGGNISGSATSTGSFGLILQNGSELSTFLGDRGTETLFSGSVASTGSFGRLEAASNSSIGNFTATGAQLRIETANSQLASLRLAHFSDAYGFQIRNTPGGSSPGGSSRLSFLNHNNSSAGSEAMVIMESTGRVGIGVTDPDSKLEVNGTGRFVNTLTLGQASSDNGSLVLHNSTGTATFTIENTNGNGIFQANSSSDRTLTFSNAGSGDKLSLLVEGDVSGSSISTASFGHFIGDGSGLENVFEGTAPSASISTRLTNLKSDSGSFSTRVTDLKTDSGSFSTRVTNLKTDSGSFSTRVTNLKIDSGSFSTRVTKNEGTGSKILNGELEFTNITGSGHISMSLSSTGSFGRVSATTIGGHSPLTVDSNTTFTNSITSSAHLSSSMTSTASFGRVNVVALGGHQSLTIDPITTFTNVITASSAVQFDGKIFIETGSIEGDLHVRTNENLMRIGKSTSGLIVSGSEQISRFATGSDGSIIDLGFTVIDEDGSVVLAGDGDGIHVDSSNYWYNNKFYKVGDGSRNFLRYEPANGIRYRGELTVNTGSFEGNMFINSPTGSMFIGKFTGGIPSSGSDNVSRFATGSDGSIIDLGFTTTNEEGETVFLTTGDGIVRDSENYWYTTGHFKVGNGEKQIEWNTTDLNVSASTVDVTTLKASDVNFAGLPTSDPLVTGSLWVSGSSSSGSYKSGFVMISGIHG